MLANLDLAWKALSASTILTDLVSRLRESDSGSDTIPSPSREAALRAIDHLTRWSGAWEYFTNTPFEVAGIRISKDLLAAAVEGALTLYTLPASLPVAARHGIKTFFDLRSYREYSEIQKDIVRRIINGSISTPEQFTDEAYGRLSFLGLPLPPKEAHRLNEHLSLTAYPADIFDMAYVFHGLLHLIEENGDAIPEDQRRAVCHFAIKFLVHRLGSRIHWISPAPPAASAESLRIQLTTGRDAFGPENRFMYEVAGIGKCGVASDIVTLVDRKSSQRAQEDMRVFLQKIRGGDTGCLFVQGRRVQPWVIDGKVEDGGVFALSNPFKKGAAHLIYDFTKLNETEPMKLEIAFVDFQGLNKVLRKGSLRALTHTDIGFYAHSKVLRVGVSGPVRRIILAPHRTNPDAFYVFAHLEGLPVEAVFYGDRVDLDFGTGSKDEQIAAVQKQIIQGLVEVSHLEERILRFYPSLFPQAQQWELENIKTSFERVKTTHSDPHIALRIADRLFTMSGAYEQSKDQKEWAHIRSLLDMFHCILLDETLQNLTQLDREVEEALKAFEKKTLGKNLGGLA